MYSCCPSKISRLRLAVAAVLVHLDVFQPMEEAAWALNLVLILFLILEMTARAFVPGLIVAQGRGKIASGQWSLPEEARQGDIAAFIERTDDAGRLLGLYQTRTVIASAMLEGVAFLAIIVYLLTQSIVGLAIAVVMIVGLALHIPTRSGVVHWIEDQLQLIEEQRRLGSA